ncbi:MAG: DUF1778 domain-containing protein [Candidatus Dormibacteraceae bacterium]
MSDTLTIRLTAQDRVTLETVARQRGIGLSSFIRKLAEFEARRQRQKTIRTEGEQVLTYLAEHPEARSELETLGTPISYLP